MMTQVLSIQLLHLGQVILPHYSASFGSQGLVVELLFECHVDSSVLSAWIPFWTFRQAGPAGMTE